MLHYCSHCGTALKPTDKHCPHCGAPINRDRSVQTPPIFTKDHETPRTGWEQFKIDYFSFNGRLPRRPFIIRSMEILILFFTLFILERMADPFQTNLLLTSLMGIPGIILIISYLSLGARRCHDLGHSGLLQILNCIPVVYLLLLVYLALAPGKKGANRYGPDPSDRNHI